MRALFERKPDYTETVFAEAQALLDDGLDLDFVLDLFPADAEWLRDKLQFTAELQDAIASEPPSYFFEASLKSKFLAGARKPAPTAAPLVPYRTAFASLSVAAGALAVGVLTLGFVTAGGAVPGDWNYGLKLANERLQYTLSSGNDRVNIQLKQTETRVEEIQQLSSRGDLSASDINRLNSDAKTLTDLARNQPFSDAQRAKLTGIVGTGNVVLNVAGKKQPALEPIASAASAALGDAITALATPSATPTTVITITPSPTSATTATPPATTTAGTTVPTATPATPTAPPETATATATPATPTPVETATKTPDPTHTASPSATTTPPTTATPPPGTPKPNP